MPRLHSISGPALAFVVTAAALAISVPRGSRPAPSSAHEVESQVDVRADCLDSIRAEVEEALLGSGFDAAALRLSYIGEDPAHEHGDDDKARSADLRAELEAIRAVFQPAIDERADALIDVLRRDIGEALVHGRVLCTEADDRTMEHLQRRASTSARRGELSYHRTLLIAGRCVEITLLGRDAPAFAAALADLRALQAERNHELALCLAAQR
jgi:hypothetical protein